MISFVEPGIVTFKSYITKYKDTLYVGIQYAFTYKIRNNACKMEL